MKIGKKLLAFLLILLLLISALGGAIGDRVFGYRPLDRWFPHVESNTQVKETTKVVSEESAVIDVVNKASPSVVTVGIQTTQQSAYSPFGSFFDPFGFFNVQPQQPESKTIEQDIGSGFIIDPSGLIVTNKHVVSDTQATYQVFVQGNDKPFPVEKIYRDPANDLAILKINAGDLKALELGDSSNLKVGQFVIAIGTALGEFRNTVTTGVVSGLGRGISAGSPYEGYAERLDNVIQTDAAINPGNSGGPLFNSTGQAIGINVAVAQGGQNIGFALPINLVKESLDNFNNTGQFDRSFLGIRYKIISKDLAVMNDLPQGAYVVEVVQGSPAEKAGIVQGDIISKVDGQNIDENKDLVTVIQTLKAGQKVSVEYYHGKDLKTVDVTLKTAE